MMGPWNDQDRELLIIDPTKQRTYTVLIPKSPIGLDELILEGADSAFTVINVFTDDYHQLEAQERALDGRILGSVVYDGHVPMISPKYFTAEPCDYEGNYLLCQMPVAEKGPNQSLGDSGRVTYRVDTVQYNVYSRSFLRKSYWPGNYVEDSVGASCLSLPQLIIWRDVVYLTQEPRKRKRIFTSPGQHVKLERLRENVTMRQTPVIQGVSYQPVFSNGIESKVQDAEASGESKARIKNEPAFMNNACALHPELKSGSMAQRGISHKDVFGDESFLFVMFGSMILLLCFEEGLQISCLGGPWEVGPIVKRMY